MKDGMKIKHWLAQTEHKWTKIKLVNTKGTKDMVRLIKDHIQALRRKKGTQQLLLEAGSSTLESLLSNYAHCVLSNVVTVAIETGAYVKLLT